MEQPSTVTPGTIDLPDVEVAIGTEASPASVYAALSDLSSHTVWAGSMHRKRNFGLRSIEAEGGPARVGTEFRSTGVDPMGSFTDRSVVTEATEPTEFEFVTEGHLQPKKGGRPPSETRITYRFEIAPEGAGARIGYRAHVTRWTDPPLILRSRMLRPIARAAMRSVAKRLLRNLSTYASAHTTDHEERER